MDLHYLRLLEVSESIRRREVSSREVTQALLARIERHEPKLNSILMLLADQALGAARRADSEIAAGQWRGPLHGVPLGIKDLHWTKDLPTTGGMDLRREFRPAEDATIVSRLKRAGAVIIAKLHMTEGFRAPGQSVERGSLDRGLLQRFGRGDRCGLLFRSDRNRHRRLDPGAERGQQPHRHQADLGTGQPLRAGSPC